MLGFTGALIRVLIGVAAIVAGIVLGKLLITVVGVALVAIFGVRAMASRNSVGGKKPW